MTMRIIRAVSFVLLVSGAYAFAETAADPASKEDTKAPVNVNVETLDVVDVGPSKGDPRGNFGIVNAKQGSCYAFAPPGGPTVEVGGSYTVIPASDVDDAVRAKLAADYPNCATVDVVGRVVQPPKQVSQ